MSEEIINKVAASGLVQLDLADYYPTVEITGFDLKEYLFMELILKEKEFRERLKEMDWSKYHDKTVAVYCSADAIIPMWAYMLVAVYLQPVAKAVIFGSEEEARKNLFLENIRGENAEIFRDKRVVIKGCGDIPIGEWAYMEMTKKLRPVVKSILYGEPCSTVPVYKSKL